MLKCGHSLSTPVAPDAQQVGGQFAKHRGPPRDATLRGDARYKGQYGFNMRLKTHETIGRLGSLLGLAKL